MAFRASGGAGGDPGLADAIHRHPRLVSPPRLGPGGLLGADRRVFIPGEGVSLPLLLNCGGWYGPIPHPLRGPAWSPGAPALGDRVQRESHSRASADAPRAFQGGTRSPLQLLITNAFNSLRWSSIRQALRDKGFPVYLRKIVDDYLFDREIEYPTMNGKTQIRKVTAGIPQGSVFGPTLWNITYDSVLRTPTEEGCIILGYADDTLILSRAMTLEEATAKVNLQLSYYDASSNWNLKSLPAKRELFCLMLKYLILLND